LPEVTADPDIQVHATQYGTSWYHSHFSAQYGNGVVGTIHIDGPASANYDVDLGVYPISDYYYTPAEEIVIQTQGNGGAPPPSDNILFNGTNINPTSPTEGAYDVVTLTPGSVHRLRLVNIGVENHIQVTLVGHSFTVIATDFVPVEPVTVDSVFIGIGQRYDVLINASQAVDNYWFNVTLDSSGLCGTSNNPLPAAIFRYSGAPDGLPTTAGTAPSATLCQDKTNYVPVVTRSADVVGLVTDLADLSHDFDINLGIATPTQWFVNQSAINVQWDNPVLSYVLSGNTSYPREENLVFMDELDVWTYWVIQNLSPLPHPMHLHGHDFLILGSDPLATFVSGDSTLLNFDNPTRRDVTMLPPLGYLVLAFRADNPGNWLFHCHIAWHVSGGLSADFMEAADQQVALISSEDLAQYNQVCEWWQEYEPSAPAKIDSGLR
jgi:FtsP/CotA-like multicopper oxidase with cupredoxin domain